MALRLTISRKIIIVYTILFVIVSFVAVLFVYFQYKNQQINNSIVKQYEPSERNLLELNKLLFESNALIRNWVFGDVKPDTDGKNRLVAIWRKHYPVLIDTLIGLSKNWDKKERDRFTTVKILMEDSVYQLHQKIMKNLGSFDDYNRTAKIFLSELLLHDIERFIGDVHYDLNSLISVQQGLVQKTQGDIDTLMINVNKTMIILFVIVLIAISILGYFAKKVIVVPITKLKDAVTDIENGHLGVTVSINSGDELQLLGNSFNSMSFQLKTNQKELTEKNKTLEQQNVKLQLAMKEIVNSREKLKDLNATKDKFFSIIAHDLRSPFNTMLHSSNILKEKYSTGLSSKVHSLIHNMSSSIKQTYTLLENLLQWSRTQTGKIIFSPQTLSFREILKETTSINQISLQKKGIEFKTTVKDDIYVYADNNMLSTIIRNLVSNATKFTNKGGQIIVKALKKDNFVEISILDTGIGISEENINKLFRIDVNYKTNGTENEKGTGLGLILCKEFVEENGGSVRVESILGKGSSFIFTIPIAKDTDEIEDVKEQINKFETPLEPEISEPKRFRWEQVPLNNTANQKVILDKLNTIFLDTYKIILENNSFKEIEVFGKKLQEFGNQNFIEPVLMFAEELLDFTDDFDVTNIEILLISFPDLIRYVEKR